MGKINLEKEENKIRPHLEFFVWIRYYRSKDPLDGKTRRNYLVYKYWTIACYFSKKKKSKNSILIWHRRVVSKQKTSKGRNLFGLPGNVLIERKLF